MKRGHESILLGLLAALLFLTGCDGMEDRIAYDIMFGGGDDSDDAQQAPNPDTPNIGKLPEFEPVDCTKPGMSKDPQSGVCICTAGNCEQDIPKQCVFDKDCSPTGVASVCVNTNTKGMYYCDLRTYTCIGGKGHISEYVDCKAEYGQNYKCVGGNCVE